MSYIQHMMDIFNEIRNGQGNLYNYMEY